MAWDLRQSEPTTLPPGSTTPLTAAFLEPPAEGELLLANLSRRSFPSSYVWPTGWTELRRELGGGSMGNLVAGRIAVGPDHPDAALDVTFASGLTGGGNLHIYNFDGNFSSVNWDLVRDRASSRYNTTTATASTGITPHTRWPEGLIVASIGIRGADRTAGSWTGGITTAEDSSNGDAGTRDRLVSGWGLAETEAAYEALLALSATASSAGVILTFFPEDFSGVLPSTALTLASGGRKADGVIIKARMDLASDDVWVRIKEAEEEDWGVSTLHGPVSTDEFLFATWDVSGLASPKTRYEYRVEAGDYISARRGKFWTTQTPGVPTSDVIGFASCGTELGDHQVYPTLAELARTGGMVRFDHMGDNGYFNETSDDPAVHLENHLAQALVPGIQELNEEVSISQEVDDHDGWSNNARRYTNEHGGAKQPGADASIRASRLRLPNRYALSGATDGLWYSEVDGRFRTLYLDVRSEQSRNTGGLTWPQSRFYGQAQIDWVAAEAAAAFAAGQILEITQSNTWISSSASPNGVSDDHVGRYPVDHQLMADAIINAGMQGHVFFKQGDGHFCAWDSGINDPKLAAPVLNAAPLNRGAGSYTGGPYESDIHPSEFAPGFVSHIANQFGLLNREDTGGTHATFTFHAVRSTGDPVAGLEDPFVFTIPFPDPGDPPPPPPPDPMTLRTMYFEDDYTADRPDPATHPRILWIVTQPAPAAIEGDLEIIVPALSELAAGVASYSGLTATSVNLSASAATGGQAPYEYQWQRALAADGIYSNISGATGLTYEQTALDDETAYLFRHRVTDALETVVYTNVLEVTTPAVGGEVAVYHDNLTSAADGSSLSTRTSPSGHTYSLTTSRDVRVTSGEAHTNGGNSCTLCPVGLSLNADQYAEADWIMKTLPASRLMRITVGSPDANANSGVNGYRVEYQTNSAAFTVNRAVGGVASTTGITPTTHTPSPAYVEGETHRVRVEKIVGVSDVTIKVYVDGVLKLTAVDTNAARITAGGGVMFTIAESTTTTGISADNLEAGNL